MRRLHVVGKHEIFLASGVYACLRHDEPAGMQEHWSMHDVDGAHFIRVDRDGRDDDGRSVLYEALYNPDGQLERIDLRAYGSATDPVQQVKASYIFYNDHAEIVRVVNRERAFEEAVALPQPFTVAAAVDIFTGYTLHAQADAPDTPLPRLNIVPLFDDVDGAFHVVMERAGPLAMQIQPARIEIAGRAVDATLYTYETAIGTARMWVDAYKILLRREQGDHVTQLTRYARRPAPKHHA